MSLLLLFEIVFGVSLFGMIFIFIRRMPLIADYEPKYIPKEKRAFVRFRKNVSEKRIETKHKTHKFREKIIQRLRISILKFDNFLLSYFKKMRERRMHLEKVYFAKREERRQKKTKEKKKED